MGSKVYFANLRSRSKSDSKVMKVERLFKKAGFKDFMKEDEIFPIKIHFGEEGSDAYIKPVFVRKVVENIKKSGAKTFVTDTNTLYSGSRHNSVDHIETAIKHGFTYATLGAPIIISDGVNSQSFEKIQINKKHFKKVNIASDIVRSDGMIVMSHFKGHELAGFGGSIKNIAMGCAPAAGKKDQHNVEFYVNKDNCVACKVCINNCPEDAISLEDGKAKINPELCIGCGECKSLCEYDAVSMDWGAQIDAFMERMTEYAYGAVKGKAKKVGYINFVINVTPDCDCAPWSDAPIVPDIGILASKDPVALDRASYDLVNKSNGFEDSLLKCNHKKGEDKFKGIRKETKGEIQLTYGEEIGLGSNDYELIEI
ncbi:MAG: DUF362 domain-containing protein [Fusobacteriota bacterium]